MQTEAASSTKLTSAQKTPECSTKQCVKVMCPKIQVPQTLALAEAARAILQTSDAVPKTANIMMTVNVKQRKSILPPALQLPAAKPNAKLLQLNSKNGVLMHPLILHLIIQIKCDKII